MSAARGGPIRNRTQNPGKTEVMANYSFSPVLDGALSVPETHTWAQNRLTSDGPPVPGTRIGDSVFRLPGVLSSLFFQYSDDKMTDHKMMLVLAPHTAIWPLLSIDVLRLWKIFSSLQSLPSEPIDLCLWAAPRVSLTVTASRPHHTAIAGQNHLVLPWSRRLQALGFCA
jgi:hypothetical protein